MTQIPLTYPIDWHGLEDFSEYHFDEHGLPRVDYGPVTGLKYNAITISQFGLYHFSIRNNTGQSVADSTTLAIRCADWLVDNARPWQNDTLAWIKDFQLPLYGPKPPWISGMAQGEAVSLLLRAFWQTGDKKYTAILPKVMKTFDYPVAEGGVTDYLTDGSPVFQEYPAQPAPHVLNGFVFALLGVLDYARYTSKQHWIDLANKGAKTILDHWQRWDTGYWTRYDLYKVVRPASTMYHELHIRQMNALAVLFNDDRFTKIANRWQRMQKNPLNRSLRIAAKVVEKIRLHGGGLY